ncbi:putative Zn(II)2Cys6 transcription factor [Halenospora varia]|nr:putative Zn(II)2Cys6 transcription factor [Halenospora varia]
MDGKAPKGSNSHHAVSRRRATCNSCRRRKSRCDNRQPRCSTCIAHNSDCHYDKPPSLAYVRSLEAKIEELLRERTGPKSSFPVSPLDSYSIEDSGNLRSPSLQATGEKAPKKDCDRWISEISVDSHGGVCYHNPTSAMHEALSKNDGFDSANRGNVTGEVSSQQKEKVKHSLVSNAVTQKRFEAMAVENMINSQNELSSSMARDFLKLHWCWIHPMFMFVYRPAFTRDMALSFPNHQETPYFSETLLKVLLAHSTRFRSQTLRSGDPTSELMKNLTQQAHLSLAMSSTKSSSIPTVQALLQQSAREIAYGNSSQAWLYSGMAFRIAIDLGIHLPSEKLRGYVKTFTDEDIEIRKRLFWSCYTWDKAISLYLGRMPAFTPPVDSNMPVFMDDFTENDPWEPYYGLDEGRTNRVPYPPAKGHMISCFTGLCKLSVILSSIMLDIYGSSTGFGPEQYQNDTIAGFHSAKNTAFVRISSSIQKWRDELPEFLRLDVANLPMLSPPLHMVSLNLLYHATLILLHRPFVIGATEIGSPAISRSYQICVVAAAAIRDLLELLTSTFGHGHVSYLNCYSTYIAATIAVLHFQFREENTMPPDIGVSGEKLDLKFFLGILQKTAVVMPALNRSVEIIKRHMQAILERRSRQYLDSLFKAASDNNPDARRTFAMDTSSATQFPTHQNQSVIQSDTITSPWMVQSLPDNGYNEYPGFNAEGLPAFPGQNFNIGTDWSLDQEVVDPELRAALLGLDSHLTLRHESSDWGL